ncbi:hypothetical protein Ahy_B06g082115 [Arachis hypogaea]|uniref:CCHC-type domain-containing protein n=1 Tax=Arachis hypogaea TaxID=3818 RepID=A0A444YMY4_ARAHY|nr:hypothetical protein Ahy_B06g082115 [Arachis hypogaea]
MDVIRATYGDSIKPVNSEELWKETNRLHLEAPNIKRSLKDQLRKEVLIGSDKRISHKVKEVFQVTCSKCRQKGHYYRTCKGTPVNPNWQPKRKKPKQQPSGESTLTLIQEPTAEIQLSQSAPLQPKGMDVTTGLSVSNNSNPLNHGAQSKAKQTITGSNNTIPPTQEQQHTNAETGSGTATTFKFVPTPGLRKSPGFKRTYCLRTPKKK